MKLYLYFEQNIISSYDNFDAKNYSGNYSYNYNNKLKNYSTHKIKNELIEEIIDIPFDF